MNAQTQLSSDSGRSDAREPTFEVGSRILSAPALPISRKHPVSAFIPHACKEHPILSPFIYELRAIGVEPILGCEQSRGGHRVDREINNLIARCNFVCPILTRRSAINPSVVSEYTVATFIGKRVIAAVQPGAKLSYIVKPKVWIDLNAKAPEIAAKKLAQSIRLERTLRARAAGNLTETIPVAIGAVVALLYPLVGIPLVIDSLIPIFKEAAKARLI